MPSTPTTARSRFIDAATANGPHVLTYDALDVAGNAETAKKLTINFDTVKPTTVAPSSATATRGKTETLKYKVTDAAPNAGKATVVIQVKNSAGKVAKTLKIGVVSIGVPRRSPSRCLGPGAQGRTSST